MTESKPQSATPQLVLVGIAIGRRRKLFWTPPRVQAVVVMLAIAFVAWMLFGCHCPDPVCEPALHQHADGSVWWCPPGVEVKK